VDKEFRGGVFWGGCIGGRLGDKQRGEKKASLLKKKEKRYAFGAFEKKGGGSKTFHPRKHREEITPPLKPGESPFGGLIVACGEGEDRKARRKTFVGERGGMFLSSRRRRNRKNRGM